MQEPRLFFDAQAAQWKHARLQSERRETLIARLRLLVALIATAGVLLAINRESKLWWLIPAACVLVFIALVKAALRQERHTALVSARQQVAEQELAALAGDYSAFPAGAAHIDPTHPFSFDLDLFGTRSIYQMLCRCVTLDGRNLLASRLQAPDIGQAAIEARQDAVRELATLPDFGCNFRAVGSLANESGGELDQLREWLAAEDEFRSSTLIRIAALLMPFVSAAGLALSFWQESMHPVLGTAATINTLLWARGLRRIKYNNRLLGRNAAIVAKYTGLLALPAGREFAVPLLSQIAATAGKSVVQLTVFNRLVSRFDSRNNGMAGSLMNILFLHDFRSLIQLERWRNRNRGVLQDALADLGTIDLLVALSGYAFANPGYRYPTLDPAGTAIRAVDLRHPLLPAHAAVGNSFGLGRDEQLYLLTGANMTGKSTFIRTVGVSMILGHLGIPLPATTLELPLLHVFTSIRVTDSVQEDVSYFRAELERIRALFDTVSGGKGNYLVLIDEPLRGTNSGDKQQGTRSIISRLIREGVTGIVATHDTGLCELEAAHKGRLRNYHFESRVEGGNLFFDFRLKPGCSTSANASLLMQQMGII